MIDDLPHFENLTERKKRSINATTTEQLFSFGVVQKDVLKRKKSISDENLLYLNQNDNKHLEVEEQGTKKLIYMNEKAGKKCRYDSILQKRVHNALVNPVPGLSASLNTSLNTSLLNDHIRSCPSKGMDTYLSVVGAAVLTPPPPPADGGDDLHFMGAVHEHQHGASTRACIPFGCNLRKVRYSQRISSKECARIGHRSADMGSDLLWVTPPACARSDTRRHR
jgi:hypothetical protein